MSNLKNWIPRIVKLGFYEGVKGNFGLAPTITSTRPADKELTIWDRESAISKIREIQTNFVLATFLVDKHIQYMATYKFQCKSPYPDFNEKFELLFSNWKRKSHCDFYEQFSFDELLQIIERHRVCDGDVMIAKVKGGKIQVIEGDRVRNAIVEKDPPDQWTHGVKCDKYGRVLQYHVANRLPDGGFVDGQHLWADRTWLVGYRNSVNQRRGTSPLLPAINHLRTLDKTFTHAAAKELLSQKLALVSKQEVNPHSIFPSLEEKQRKLQSEVSESFEGIKVVNLNETDSLEILESKNPSQNTQQFWEAMIRMVLLALKIPYTFYDGSKTTYFGAEGEYNQYFDSCATDQIPMLEWLHELSEWLLNEWVAEELVELPDGETTESMSKYLRWNSGGMPFFLMFRLVKDAHTAMMVGATTPQKFAAWFGNDFGENAREMREAIEGTNGIPYIFAQQTPANISS
ncbi:MAG: phage portal protein [Planctomycetaceae bacterium]|nr:phage portal protein [Planctomycetaceae bacterium]